MTKSFLNIKGIGSCFQEKGCMGVTQRMEVEQRHAQLLVNDAIGVLQ